METKVRSDRQVERQGMVARMRNRAAVVIGLVAAVLMGAVGTASATPPVDPTGGAGDTFFTTLTDYLQDNLITAVLGLAVIGVVVSLILSWGRKAAKSK